MSECPHCDKDIENEIASAHAGQGCKMTFKMICPHCDKRIAVEVEVVEVEYLCHPDGE